MCPVTCQRAGCTGCLAPSSPLNRSAVQALLHTTGTTPRCNRPLSVYYSSSLPCNTLTPALPNCVTAAITARTSNVGSCTSMLHFPAVLPSCASQLYVSAVLPSCTAVLSTDCIAAAQALQLFNLQPLPQRNDATAARCAMLHGSAAVQHHTMCRSRIDNMWQRLQPELSVEQL